MVRVTEVAVWAVLAGLAGTACATDPQAPDPLAALALAEGRLGENQPGEALALLELFGADAYLGPDLERYKLALGTALAQTGSLWDSYILNRNFEEDHPFSDYRAGIQDLEYQIGRTLIESSWTFLFFASDREDGQKVLEHFVLRYPRHPASDDALRLLGEKAFDDGEYRLAQERFGDLVLRHEDSEWAALAQFRIAMSSFLTLVGPAYDIQSMSRAHNELQAFLDERIENPKFESEARRALKTVREWLGEKHLMIANFYHTIGNSAGYRTHLETGARDFPETTAGQEASRLLAQLPAEDQL